MTSLILVRHGEVPGITPPSFRGRQDLSLTKRGVQQAELTRDYLARILRLQRVYASPLSRCLVTGTIIAEPHSLGSQTAEWFTDIDYGEWQGRTFDEVQTSQPAAFAAWLRTPHLASLPGGESLNSVAERVAQGVGALFADHANHTIALVGHESVNRVLLLLALDLPLSRYWRIGQEPCAISILTHREANGWVVHSMNETAHLVAVT